MVKIIDFKKASLRNIAIDVLCGDSVILKEAVSPDLIRQAVSACHAWSSVTPESKAHPGEMDGATHLKSFLPPRSESRYILHDYYFYPSSERHCPVPSVMPVFDALLDIYNRLFDKEYTYGVSHDGYALMPQVIQYPRGGGFFAEHFHPIQPQKIGLVLAGSEYGKDYFNGGGRFRSADGSWSNTEGAHQIGDISLFRFDIGHDITPVDPDCDMDWARVDGRWTFVLPLKPIPKY
jgi:hypothetical protein